MKRVKDSLAAKVFIYVFCALMLCGGLIYAVVGLALPGQYTTLVNAQTSANIDELAASIDGKTIGNAQTLIYEFCIANQTYAVLQADGQTLEFGDSGRLAGVSDTINVSSSLKLAGTNDPCILNVIAPASAENSIKDTLVALIPAVVVLILCISALSAWLCSRIIVRPVLDISRVSRRMANLDMTWHCGSDRTDELGMLAESLNTMSQRLTRAMSELEEANEQLRRDVEVAHIVEKQRRDFFSAASHELKTPVAILHGQLESMELGIGDYKNHDKYLPEALATVERMEGLIREILSISKMEAGISPAVFTDEHLTPVLQACIAEITPLAESKDITLTCAPMQDILLRMYKPLFKKALTNILANAVQYSPTGERVSISVSSTTIAVENSGTAIADDDLPSLFKPFYRAEKSRNRKSGGSGLGLYIVKMILDMHGFGCTVENTGSGVKVTVSMAARTENSASKSKQNQA